MVPGRQRRCLTLLVAAGLAIQAINSSTVHTFCGMVQGGQKAPSDLACCGRARSPDHQPSGLHTAQWRHRGRRLLPMAVCNPGYGHCRTLDMLEYGELPNRLSCGLPGALLGLW